MQKILINRAPMGVSLQDAGRGGYLRYGISAAGPMDWARHAMANHMLAKPAGAAVLEVGPAGLGLTLQQGELQMSFAGPRFEIHLQGRIVCSPLRFTLQEGQTLDIRPRSGAMWGYLGIQGEFDLPPLLGSLAENSVSGIAVKQIREGVSLNIIGKAVETNGIQQFIDPFMPDEARPIGILPASQFDYFSEAMKATLVDAPTKVSSRFDRMAYRLENIQLLSKRGHDILSDGVTMGVIQVPGDGQPFVLMGDHQPTGGYPKVACVCKADLPRMAQMSPGKSFMFSWITLQAALKRWATLQQQISSLVPLSGV